MPYPLPDDLNEVGISSVCVYLPDKPEFRQALLGSLSFFAKWVAWERTDDNRASMAAALWTIAHDMTTRTWEDECACPDCPDCPDCEDDMTCNNVINVNCGDCGPGGGDTFIYYDGDGNPIVNPGPIGDYIPDSDYTLPDPVTGIPTVDLEGQEPPEGFDTWESFNASACKTANAIVDYAIDAMRVIENIVERDIPLLAAIVVALVNVQTFGIGILFKRALYVKIAEVIMKIKLPATVEYIVDLFPNLKTYLIENREEIVCEIYNARGDLPAMGNTLVSRLVAETAQNVAHEATRSMTTTLFNLLFPGKMAANAVVDFLTDDYVGETDCSLCQQCIEGYVLQSPTLSSWVHMGSAHEGESATATITGNSLYTTGTLSTSLYYGRHIIQQSIVIDLAPLNPGTLTNNAILVSMPQGAIGVGFYISGTWYAPGDVVLVCGNYAQGLAIMASGIGGATVRKEVVVTDLAAFQVHLGREGADGPADGTILIRQVNNCV